MCLSRTNDHIQIKIKMLNRSQEPPAPTKDPNQDLKDMDDLCTFKIKIESQNSEYRWFKDKSSYPSEDQDAKPQSGTSSTPKAPNQDLKDMDVLCTFKIKIESQTLDHGYIKDQWSYLNQDQDDNPQSGTRSILQSPKSVLKGHGCLLNLQN